ncbi:ABC transporter permease [Viridibacillus sp. FSL R5-0477]|uniref:Peptide ABC transporter permease n=1 Tax=Viridibacillus arenosi FSL R5-213 TaxID=1227360 RepID=W4F6K5_9BACL|nr:ABC transporter permease [Viridibacillus arenosi]ETT87934.1 peptide ABC transporter permease [Viridibacillus arenosi FSL R5-213]OMC87562.1 peptide ABC transporter permease [Viridibacillus arenosi]
MTIQQDFALKRSQEYKHALFVLVISIALVLVFLVNAFDVTEGTWNKVWGSLTIAYLVIACWQTIILVCMKRDLQNTGDIQKRTRLMSAVNLLTILVGNVFTTTFAFRMLRRKASIEYTLSYYMLLTQLLIVSVSLLNLFKPYVSDMFLLSMAVFILLIIFDVVAVVIFGKLDTDRHIKPAFKWLGIALIITGFSGNIFGFILGYSVLLKSTNRDMSTIDKWNKIWSKITKNFTAMLGLLFVIFTFAISIASYGTFVYEFAVENNYESMLLEPSLANPFGTDNFGRDVFSRIIYGARISLIVGVVSTIIPLVIGGFLGAVAGYYNKSIDNVIMRILDVLYAVPGILLAIAIIAAFGANTVNLIIALSVGSIPTYARTMRANVMMVSNLEFVEAAKALGEEDWKIIFKQVVPNSFAPMIVKATLTIGGAVIATSSLSFLGLGVEPHIPEWGNILKVGSMYLETNPYLAIFPGIAIILLVLSFNFLGDGLRDALDPKLD